VDCIVEGNTVKNVLEKVITSLVRNGKKNSPQTMLVNKL